LLALFFACPYFLLGDTFSAILDELQLDTSGVEATAPHVSDLRCTVRGGIFDYECKFELDFLTKDGFRREAHVELETLFQQIPSDEMP
jgi:hypothetical protein